MKDTLSSADRIKIIQDYFGGNNLRGSGKMGLQKEREYLRLSLMIHKSITMTFLAGYRSMSIMLPTM